MVRGPRAADVLTLGMLAVGVLVGLGTVLLAWQAPSFSRVGATLTESAIACAAGWSLMLAGAVTSLRDSRRAGALLSAAGLAWFLSDWANPASAPALVFTLGLLLGSAWPALLIHAVLGASPLADLRNAGRVVVAAAYLTNGVVLGLVPTVAFDPVGSRCLRCPDNLLAFGNDPILVVASTRIGFGLEAAWVVGAVAVIVARLARTSGAERRRTAPVSVSAAIALSATAAGALYSIARGRLSNDPVDIALWSVAALALIGLAAGVGASWWRRRTTRQRVARLALDLAATPPAGELAPALGRMLGDPALEVLFPLDDGRLVDASGISRSVPVTADRASTQVHRAGAPVAVLIHRADLAHDAARMADAVDAARLALENERLHAQSQARVVELRRSRAQIVAAAEAERRRLEHDLHDGSQQRLLAFAIDLAIARERTSGANSEADDLESKALEADVRAALGDLRELAHGILPRALAEDGIGAALEELVERSTIPIELLDVPSGRLDGAAEAAAYVVVARATRDAAVRRASVHASRIEGQLIVELSLDLTGDLGEPMLVDLEDRCGAIDGILSRVILPNGRTQLRAEIPCVS
jgi:signal transduction histidine kinase